MVEVFGTGMGVGDLQVLATRPTLISEGQKAASDWMTTSEPTMGTERGYNLMGS